MTSNHQRPRVLICDRIADDGINMLKEQAEVDVKTGLSPDELLQIIGNYFDEARLLNVAHQYQRVTDWHSHRPPEFDA